MIRAVEFKKGFQCHLQEGLLGIMNICLSLQNEPDLERAARQECSVERHRTRKAKEQWGGGSARCLCWFHPDVDAVRNSERFTFVSLEIKTLWLIEMLTVLKFKGGKSWF